MVRLYSYILSDKSLICKCERIIKMTVYMVRLSTVGTDNTSTFLDFFNDEYKAAYYTATINEELMVNDRYDIEAVCVTKDVDNTFGIDFKDYLVWINYDYTIFADVVYDYVNDKVIQNKKGIKYIPTRNSLYIMNSNSKTMRCFIPYEKGMIDILHKRARLLYEHRRNKTNINKRNKR